MEVLAAVAVVVAGEIKMDDVIWTHKQPKRKWYWNIFSWFRTPTWEEQVEINRRKAEREEAERERRKRLAPDLLIKLQDCFCDMLCSNGEPLKFTLGDAPLGEDCVIVRGPHHSGWIVPAELHKRGQSGYYILYHPGASKRVSENNLMATITKLFAG